MENFLNLKGRKFRLLKMNVLC